MIGVFFLKGFTVLFDKKIKKMFFSRKKKKVKKNIFLFFLSKTTVNPLRKKTLIMVKKPLSW